MEKKTFWLVESNGDLSMTVADLETVKTVIENDIDGVDEYDVENFQYTVTPVLMTQEDFENMPEAEF